MQKGGPGPVQTDDENWVLDTPLGDFGMPMDRPVYQQPIGEFVFENHFYVGATEGADILFSIDRLDQRFQPREGAGITVIRPA